MAEQTPLSLKSMLLKTNIINMQISRTNSAPTPKEDHITPNWYHSTIIKIESKQNKLCDSKEEEENNEIIEVSKMLDNACKLREKYVYKNHSNNGHIGSMIQSKDILLNINCIKDKSLECKYSFEFIDGVTKIYKHEEEKESEPTEKFKLYTFKQYIEDLNILYELMSNGPAKSFCYDRLKILQCRFKLHLLLNQNIESIESSSIPYRDFYNVRKIDNHIHHTACMHQKHLLSFIQKKYKNEPHKIIEKNHQKTLKQIFDELNITDIEHLSVNKLDVHCQQTTFHRFDKFNTKYNPLGERSLRKIFLKIDNEIKGQYLAEITKEVVNELEKQKYQFCEYRLSVHGKKKEEWDIIADWICNNKLHSEHIRWMIQIPRKYHKSKKLGLINNFSQMMSNIFTPLFETTINPLSHPTLHLFLQIMVGFDCVDDESVPEVESTNYDINDNNNYNDPPYMYYMYYLWCNIYKLNKLREERGFSTFAFRPHSGEAGPLKHLASTFLVANSINHGIRLKQSPVLQYLYYLKQIGMSISPLSNNILFEEYDKNPFPIFFERGLNVTLSSDDPLLIHYTENALTEEYSTAAQVYKLSRIDLCEIARNSVIQSGWDYKTKQEWIGNNYYTKKGAFSNDIYKTNVPNSRLQFRYLLLEEERKYIHNICTNNDTTHALLSSLIKEISDINDITDTERAHFVDIDQVSDVDNVDHVDIKHEDQFDEEDKNVISMRDVNCNDLDIMNELTISGHVANEIIILSQELLYFLFIFAKEYIKIFTLNNKIIGFISGITTNNKTIIHPTDDMLRIHDKHGKHLYIHSVVIHSDYKNNNKCIQDIIKIYVRQQTVKSNKSLLSIRLICKNNLISLYDVCGLKLIDKPMNKEVFNHKQLQQTNSSNKNIVYAIQKKGDFVFFNIFLMMAWIFYSLFQKKF